MKKKPDYKGMPFPGARKKKPKKYMEEEESKVWKPIKMIGSLLLALIIILMIIPFYNIKLDPSPEKIPAIEDVFNTNEYNIPLNQTKQMMNIASYLTPETPLVKQTATKIVTSACENKGNNRVCYAKAIFYFVRDNFNYVNDPVSREYFQNALETLSVKGGDCDDLTILTANLMRSIGINTRFVLVSGHVYLQIHLSEAIKSYKTDKTDWINLDPTCSNCEFGKLTLETANKDKNYVG